MAELAGRLSVVPDDSKVYLLPIVGTCVVEVLSEYALVLVFADTTRIRLEMPFRLQMGGRERTYDPQSDAEDFADFQSFVGSVVSEATTSTEGALRLVLDRGAIIEVDPSDTYEAWEFVGLNGSHVIALGDRSLAIWDPRDDESRREGCDDRSCS